MAIETTLSNKLQSLLRRCLSNPLGELAALPEKVCHLFSYLRLHGRREQLVDRLALRQSGIPNWELISDIYRVAFLSPHLTVEARMQCLEAHYDCLLSRLPASVLPAWQRQPLTLWEDAESELPCRITLSLPLDESRNEGDFLLCLDAAGEAIFKMNCAMVPGPLFGGPPGPCLFVGRMQGTPGNERIRQVTRQLAHVPPPYILLAAAQGIAQAFDLTRLVGIGATQLCHKREHFSYDYPALWASLDAEPQGDFHSLPVPFPERDLSEVSSRSRTLKKRRLKGAIRDAAADALRRQFTGADA